MKRCIFLFLVLTFTVCFTFAQDFVKIPNSPEAAALIKQTDYPVDMSRGLIDISIPLLRLTSGNLILPINLSYHAGGFRKDERSTRSGLGWSISADLQITRVINDKDDLATAHGYLVNTMIKGEETTFFDRNGSGTNVNIHLMDSVGDGSPDKFSFSLLGKTGTFVAKKNSAGTSYEFVSVPYDNIKISYSDGAFTILDTDGTRYQFGRTNSEVGPLYATYESAAEHLLERTDLNITAWKCYKVSSAQGNNSMVFEYEQKGLEYQGIAEDEIVVYKNESSHSSAITWYEGNNTAVFAPTYWEGVLPTKSYPIGYLKKPLVEQRFGGISDFVVYKVPYYNSSTGQIVFQDKRSQSANGFRSVYIYGLSLKKIITRSETVEFTGANRLSAVRQKTSGGTVIRSVDLFHSAPTLNSNGHVMSSLYLDSIHVYGADVAQRQRFALNYYSKDVFGYQLKGSDMWGFVNDHTFNSVATGQSNVGTIPYQELTVGKYYNISTATVLATNKSFSIGMPSASQRHTFHPSSTGMLKGMLKNIIYPGGHYTEFDYEPHQYRETLTNGSTTQSVAVQAGGLRIRTVNYGDIDGYKLLKQEYYVYGSNEDGTGVALIRPPRAPELRYYNFVGVRSDPTYQIYYKRTVGTGNVVSTQFITMDTIYRYRPGNYYNYSLPNGSPVYYTSVTRYEMDGGQQKGKTVFDYYDPAYYMSAYSSGLFEMYRLYDFDLSPIKIPFEIGLQRSVTTYARDDRADRRFKKVSRKNYSYMKYQQSGVIRAVLVRKKYLFRALDSSAPYANSVLYKQTPSVLSGANTSNVFSNTEYNMYSGKMLLEQEQEIAYFGETDSTVVLRNYTYGALPYLHPSSVQTVSSEGLERTSEYKYSYDYSGAIPVAMRERNILDHPMEKIDREGGAEIYRQKTDYQSFGTSGLYYGPSQVSESYSAGALRVIGHYDLYDDYGNLLQYRERDGLPKSVLWGFNATRPVMFATNLSYTAIPFRSSSQIISPLGADELSAYFLANHSTVTWPEASDVKYLVYDIRGNLREEIDARLTRRRYSYDDNGRLTVVRDDVGNVLNGYTYNLYRWAYSSMLPSFSRPIMESICWQGSPYRHIYNSVSSGGSVSAMGIDNATETAHSHLLYNMYYGLDYTDTTLFSIETASRPFVEVRLYGAYMVAYDYPKYAYVDFVKDGQVVASKKLLFNLMATNPKEYNVLYVPAGSYKLSFRVDPSAKHEDGFFTNFALKNTTTNASALIAHGSGHNFVAGNQYEVWVTNF
ncbi:RHS repeat domain-containing protein [Sphingobacterium sp. LRF_L2]|uniref:RHS repeat protein n=1 Tax=Sphingobacterium sp. LRF_L2 TaxID=3369421 RepID=UPI003F5F3EA2